MTGEQKAILQILKDRAHDQERILQSFVGSLYDGLRYGNWPWTKI